MSQSIGVLDLSFVAEADLRTLQYCVVTGGTAAGSVKKCGTSDVPLGVLQNKPNTGEPAQVRVLGTSKVYADGAFAYMDQLAVADANGEVDTVGAAPVNIIGIALEAAGKAHVYVEMFVNRAFEGSSIAPAALTAACTFQIPFSWGPTVADIVATITSKIVGIAPCAGDITFAGFTLGNTGTDASNALSMEGDWLINGVTVFSTKPVIAKNASDGAKSTTAGTGVTVGVLNAAAVAVVAGDIITFVGTLTRTATPSDELDSLFAYCFIEPKVGA